MFLQATLGRTFVLLKSSSAQNVDILELQGVRIGQKFLDKGWFTYVQLSKS